MITPWVLFFLIFWIGWYWISSWTVLLPFQFAQFQHPRWNFTTWRLHYISYVPQKVFICLSEKSNSFSCPPRSACPPYMVEWWSRLWGAHKSHFPPKEKHVVFSIISKQSFNFCDKHYHTVTSNHASDKSKGTEILWQVHEG